MNDFATIDGDMSAKDQYMRLRSFRRGLVLDQIAFYAPDATAEEKVKGMFGLREAEWTEDFVTGRVSVFGEPEQVSQAKLLFNYDLGIELEILTYTLGPNWHRHRAKRGEGPPINPGCEPFVSHIGFHVNEEELPFRLEPAAQRMVTTFHSNPAIADRRYEYVIYDTFHSLGVDLKYIKRLA